MDHVRKTTPKKILLVFACLIIVFALSSCKDDSGGVSFIEGTATPTVEPTASPATSPTATPTAEPTSTPTVEPTTSPTASPALSAEPGGEPTDAPEGSEQPETAITVESVTTPVKRGADAVITIKAEPDTEYKLQVFYPSGESKAAGLGSAVTDGDGYASWTWKVGVNTTVATHYAIVSDANGDASIRIEFTVVE